MATLRADHVGSFLRPPELLEARRRHARGLLSNEQLTEIEDASILKILEVQLDAGLEVFSDGEYRRGIYSGALTEALEGLVPSGDSQFANLASAWHGPDVSLAVEALEEVRPHWSPVLALSRSDESRGMRQHFSSNILSDHGRSLSRLRKRASSGSLASVTSSTIR